MRFHKNTAFILLIIGTVVLGMAAGCSPEDTAATINIGGNITPTPPANIQVVVTPAAIANSGTATVTATVTDASGNPESGETVSFTVSNPAAGSFNPAATATTNASGVASVTFAAAAAVDAVVTITGTVTTTTGTLVDTASLTIGTPPRIPTSVTVALGASSIDNPGGPADNTTVTATVRDATGVIPNTAVDFTFSVPGAGTFTPLGPWTTNAAGQVIVTFTAGVSDTIVDITATAGTVSNSASLTIGTPVSPPPTSMSITISPLSIGILSQATVTVTLLTATGTPAYSQSVTLTITVGTTLASFSPMPSSVITVPLTTNTSGVASAIIYTGSSSGTVTVEATSGALTPKSASVLITSDPASLTLNVVNSNLINGDTTSITADVRNLANNPVSNGTVVNFLIVSLPPIAGTLSATQASTVNGIASVTFTADDLLTGGVIIEASAGTLTPVQTIIIVNAAQAGSLEFVSADPNVISIFGAGISSSTVTFKVLSTAGQPLGSQPVNFRLYGPTGATLTGGGTTSSGSTNQQGEVTTILQAGPVAGPCRIVATTTVPGPPVVTLAASSGAISIGGGLPSDRFFDISVSKFNLDGLGCNGVESTLGVWVADRFGNYNILEGTSVSFATDSGAVDTSNVTGPTGTTVSIFRTQAPRPTDVLPVTLEPYWDEGGELYADANANCFWDVGEICADINSNGVCDAAVIRNPRDGWATVLVTTTGEEHFVDNDADGVYDYTDTNGNGVQDPGETGETFTDLPEPFIDSNDDGGRTSGELFFDWPSYVIPSGVNPVNPNGVYDIANTIWNSRIPIYRTLNLVFTGAPYQATSSGGTGCPSRIVTSSAGTGQGSLSIPKGSSRIFYVFVADRNLNAPIGGTSISASATASEAQVELALGSESIPDHLSYGPWVVGYRVTNNNSGTAAVTTSLQATISWPGTCGSQDLTIFYPGTITLDP